MWNIVICIYEELKTVKLLFSIQLICKQILIHRIVPDKSSFLKKQTQDDKKQNHPHEQKFSNHAHEPSPPRPFIFIHSGRKERHFIIPVLYRLDFHRTFCCIVTFLLQREFWVGRIQWDLKGPHCWCRRRQCCQLSLNEPALCFVKWQALLPTATFSWR